jgi:hypothetical protein
VQGEAGDPDPWHHRGAGGAVEVGP